MRTPSRSPKTLLLLAFSAIVFLTFTGRWFTLPGASTANDKAHPVPIYDAIHDQSRQGDIEWTWTPERDRDNSFLSDAHCESAFPSLYEEIDRAAAFWAKSRRKITPANIDLDWSWDGGLRCMIYNQQLYIIYSRGLNHFDHWWERHHATLQSIYRAIMTAPEPVPNIEFSIKINDVVNITDDFPDTTFWTFSRDIHNSVHDRLWVIPDFNFWAYPRVAGSFRDFQHRAMEVGGDFKSKVPKLVWRGTLDFNREVREPLLEQSKGQPWSDVVRVDEDANADARITMEDHCKYKFAVHTEGTTWSGRLKYLLSCNVVVFAHPLTYYTHLYHLLQPEGPQQNFVSLKKDWSDLPAQVQGMLDNEQKAEMVANNAAAVFRDRYATPAAQMCYFRRLFKVWRQSSFEPDPFEITKLTDGTVYKKVRGMTFEEYIATAGAFNVE